MRIEFMTFFIGLAVGICFASISTTIERLYTEVWEEKIELENRIKERKRGIK